MRLTRQERSAARERMRGALAGLDTLARDASVSSVDVRRKWNAHETTALAAADALDCRTMVLRRIADADEVRRSRLFKVDTVAPEVSGFVANKLRTSPKFRREEKPARKPVDILSDRPRELTERQMARLLRAKAAVEAGELSEEEFRAIDFHADGVADVTDATEALRAMATSSASWDVDNL